MTAHSYDGIDWDARVQRLRAGDELTAPETAEMVRRLLSPGDRRVVDVGAGAGGSAAAFAGTLGSGVVTLVDSAPQLLAAATGHAWEAAASEVEIRAVQGDLASDEWLSSAEQADLVFASFVVHHLPDQRAGLTRLASLARPGGRLAVVEPGLELRVLPWDAGVGEPGLEGRLIAARDEWFRQMRAEMPESVRMPVGWEHALTEAGLADVHSWSYLIDRPPPVSELVRQAVVRRLEWLREIAQERSSADDLRAADELLDPGSPHYVGHRDDIRYLAANTVYVGTRQE